MDENSILPNANIPQSPTPGDEDFTIEPNTEQAVDRSTKTSTNATLDKDAVKSSDSANTQSTTTSTESIQDLSLTDIQKDIVKGMSPKLTGRQKLFIIKYIEHNCDDYKALIEAGYSEKSARVNVSLFKNHPLIQVEISKIQNAQLKKICQTKQGQLDKLERFIKIAEDKRDVSGAAKHIDIQCKMLGFYAPTQVEHNGEIKISFGTASPIPLESKGTKDGIEDFTSIDEPDKDINIDSIKTDI